MVIRMMKPDQVLNRRQQIGLADRKAYEIVGAVKAFLVFSQMHDDPDWWRNHLLKYVLEFDALWEPLHQDNVL